MFGVMVDMRRRGKASGRGQVEDLRDVAHEVRQLDADLDLVRVALDLGLVVLHLVLHARDLPPTPKKHIKICFDLIFPAISFL